MKEKIPLMYLYMHQKLIERFGIGIISRRSVFELLGRYYRVRKSFLYPILKELQDYNLVVKHSLSEVYIMKSTFNLTNSSAVYRLVGLY